MNKILPLFSCFLFSAAITIAQPKTQTPSPVMPFGKIDKADLELTSCDFEKDANAMVLFEKGDLYYDDNFNVVIEMHKRIKIFNDNGKDAANIKIDYDGGNRFETISGFQAQTINLDDDKIEMTKVDSKQVFDQVIDKYQKEYAFTFPNVKPGSVIEYKYRLTINDFSYIPDWAFQGEIPIKYTEFDTSIPEFFYFSRQARVIQSFAKSSTTLLTRTIGSTSFNCEIQKLALDNVASLKREPYMSSDNDNIQKITYHLTVIRPIDGMVKTFADTWPKIANILSEDEDFGNQLNRHLTNEEQIIAHAKALKTDDEKMAYVFNEVKNFVKWNGINHWYTIDGTKTAWDKKIGNSAEVNIILYHLLKQAGVKVYPMAVSTRKHGKVMSFYPTSRQFNSVAVYYPIDSTRYYVMDATNKYNVYNEISDNLLNNYGLFVDKNNKDDQKLVYIEKAAPVRKVVLINAEITPDGRMSGNASISTFSYDRMNALSAYKTLGEKKYSDELADHDNNLKVTSLKFENEAIDSLPLNQNIAFKMNLPGSEQNYIIFNSNLFTHLHKNEFLSEDRSSNIDFGFKNTLILSGNYKIPAGYKVDAMPQNMVMSTPDHGISFKRLTNEQDGTITIRYTINYSKSQFLPSDYPAFREFYKKMHELLNEQVVLKKS